jgi:hypothetical protein
MTTVEDRLVHRPGPAVTEGSALLRAAAAAGHGARVHELLGGAGSAGGEDAELLLWAADYGAVEVIRAGFGGPVGGRMDQASKDTAEAALRIARGWTGAEPEAELRRRLGGGSGTVERETVPVDDYERAGRIRVTAADGRWAEVQTAHPAIVTFLEDRLGHVVSRDELMARALADRDPGSANWSQSCCSVSQRPDAEATLRWATGLLAGRDPDVRRFAAAVVETLSFDQAPCRPETLAALRARLAAEPDAGVLNALIVAFANYRGAGDLPEVVAHAGHPDAQVRACVAIQLAGALMDPGSAPGAVEPLTTLGRDRDARVRAAALQTLRDYRFDHPAARELLAAGRDDPDPRVRLEALAGLARGGDAAAGAQLRRLAAGAGPGSRASSLAGEVELRLRMGTPAATMPHERWWPARGIA